jgi:hypothetical protein
MNVNLKALQTMISDMRFEINGLSGRRPAKAEERAALKDRIEALRKDMEVKRARIAQIRGERDKRRERIKELTKALRQMLRRKKMEKGLIDENGYIVIEGKATGLRAGGTASFEIMSAQGGPLLQPIMATGEYFFGMDKDGKPVSLGVLQEVEIPKDKKRKMPVYKKGRAKRLMAPEKPKEGDGAAEARAAAAQKGPATLVKAGDVAQPAGLKNPFESLGLLPSMVKELSTEDLRSLVRALGKALMAVTHPDAGGDTRMSAEINGARKHLEDAAFFDSAKAAYAASLPGESRLKELGRHAELLRQDIMAMIPQLADNKVAEKRAMDRSRQEREECRRFLPLLQMDVFTDKTRVPGNDDAMFLRRCGGMSLKVVGKAGAKVYSLMPKGFDMLAVEKNTDAFIRLVGSIRRERFSTLEDAKGAVEPTPLYDIFLHAQPVIYPKGYLVGMKDNQLDVLGTIESIEKGKAVARRMRQRIADGKLQRRPEPLKKRR